MADRSKRADPVKLTEEFHRSVPVLAFLDWKVLDTQRGYAKTVLPLNVNGSNQHIAHQAAVMMIAADYTGGIALGTILNGVPLVGIHAQETDYGAYLWGARADTKWIKPSTDDLICTARISSDRHPLIAKRFFQGRRVLETVRIEMHNGQDLVAEANFTYWVQDTYALRRNAFDEAKIHALFEHRTKASARLIAGLRALEQDRPAEDRLFEDTLASKIAERHGRLLAERFCLIAPQLQPMVAARTKHLDDTLENFHKGSSCQVINIGSGFDVRFNRVALPAGSKIFNLDLPHMLRRRSELMVALRLDQSNSFTVPVDLNEHDISEVLFDHADFDPDQATLVIWEGGSMYFTPEQCTIILESISRILRNTRSRFWMDYVRPEVVSGYSDFEAVTKFVDAMRSLGEPFIHGIDGIDEFFNQAGLKLISDDPSGTYQTNEDQVYQLYRFTTSRLSVQ
ncbi:SAM-dependent methyltransferase [Methylobacterium sp. J-030]|uniref:SAM-dependent methyltransferase n=1 Tax=Methylobacterium sp. J-030 TaxID=2836627 RepID=UPI001FB96C15|nr:SAM-dependent methyltransferase [Methylobacterium sp. J-030]MCJ2069238.1 SAM-dependent methyltransferase [Methylobacterium sp. J-030]